jgi:deoxyhypusine monooxygenase
MVRHEAGEALGAIATEDCLAPLRQYQQDPCLEVAQTCQLALQRIEYFMSQKERNNEDGDDNEGEEGEAALLRRYLSVDPTPPAPPSIPTTQLATTLIDKDAKIFDRYRAMFALRDRGGEEAVQALTSALDGPDGSALLKHEVAYVLGQMQDPAAFEALRKSLENSKENAMVRHEAAEALGSIAAPECLKLLEKYRGDQEPIVADSCVVALDMLEFEQSGEFQYADVGV